MLRGRSECCLFPKQVPVLGNKSDRCLRQREEGFVGVAVKVARAGSEHAILGTARGGEAEGAAE